MATGKHLHFLLPGRVWGSPHTSPPHPAPAPGGTRGRQWWKWSSSCSPSPHIWQPPRAAPATTDKGDKLHLSQAKVKNTPRTSPSCPRPPASLAAGYHTACPAPSQPQGSASRNSLCDDIFSLPLFPPRYFTQAQKQKGKKPLLFPEQAQANHN